ncbi:MULTISPECIES: hypothetical protein [Sphingomonadales]|uniref:hypothetical protein n=1 Tax=Sphingomonadales TaxID=204457 RepID=UPI000AB4AA5E|nr:MULTISPECIES: hypothetical protein [Sphingomonadales]
MPRSVHEIATDLRQAVSVMTNLTAEMAEFASGKAPTGRTPKIEVRLDDGRVVELGALANELLAAAGGE